MLCARWTACADVAIVTNVQDSQPIGNLTSASSTYTFNQFRGLWFHLFYLFFDLIVTKRRTYEMYFIICALSDFSRFYLNVTVGLCTCFVV